MLSGLETERGTHLVLLGKGFMPITGTRSSPSEVTVRHVTLSRTRCVNTCRTECGEPRPGCGERCHVGHTPRNMLEPRGRVVA